jgi:hypothetical protein
VNRGARLGEPAVRSIATHSAVCAIAAACIVAGTALFVVATGLSEDARQVLNFDFGGIDHTPTEAARIALHNAKYAGGTLFCAILAPWLPWLPRLLTDYVLATLLVLNSGTIGVAFGAYYGRALAATAPHLPLEFAGLSLAGGAYLHACRRPLSTRALIATSAGCALLLAAGALTETYVSMGGAR